MYEKISVLLNLVILALVQMPWLVLDGVRCNIYQARERVRALGMQALSENAQEIMRGWYDEPDKMLGAAVEMELNLLLLYQVFCVLYLLTVLLRKNWHLNLAALFVLCVSAMVNGDGFAIVSDNLFAKVFPILFGVLGLAEFLLARVLEEWDDASRAERARKAREKEWRAERKRRLYFPGKYEKIFYRVVWKNFLYNWRDYLLFVICGTIVTGVIFAGFGVQRMMSQVHRAESFLLTQGLGQILISAMLPIGLISVVLIVFVLLFYLQNRLAGYGMFITLGIRRRTLALFIALEFAGSFLSSVTFGCLLGNGLLLLFRQFVRRALGGEAVLLAAGIGTYGKMLLTMAGIYLAALMATRDVYLDFSISTAASRKCRKEKLPQDFTKILTLAGVLLLGGCIYLYSLRKNYEYILLLAAGFVGVFLVFRYGMAVYLKAKQRGGRYFPALLKENQIRHKSRTSAWYLTVFTVIHVCALFYFAFQMLSVTIAEAPETLYPYDFMCIADAGDAEVWTRIEERYGAEILRFPMVRVSSADKTQRKEPRTVRTPQGQHIGISESTYHLLKKQLDPAYRASPLHLDAEGEEVYIVYQQDKSINAQPTDFFGTRSSPYLHIGQPCYYFDNVFPERAFPTRRVRGEEIGSLTGAFRQGKLENLIVFSDAYFAKAQKLWEETNIRTGEQIREAAERIPEVTIHQGPTELVLIRAEEADVEGIDAALDVLRENHVYDAQFDSEVLCCYPAAEAVDDLATERTMKLIVNGFVVAVLVMASVFMLWVKMLAEMEEKRARSVFLECMGMREKDRKKLVEREVALFYILPAVCAVVISAGFTAATCCARMYTPVDIKAYLGKMLVWWAAYLVAEGLVCRVLMRMSVLGTERR